MMMISVKRDKVQFALLQLLFGLCVIALVALSFHPIFAKILGVAGITALVIFAGYQKLQKE
jgi:O-antigen ligase